MFLANRERKRSPLVLAGALSIAASGGGQSLTLVTEQDVLPHTCFQALFLWGKRPAWGKRLPLSQLWTGFHRWHEPMLVTWLLPSDSTGHQGLKIGSGYIGTHRCG